MPKQKDRKAARAVPQTDQRVQLGFYEIYEDKLMIAFIFSACSLWGRWRWNEQS